MDTINDPDGVDEAPSGHGYYRHVCESVGVAIIATDRDLNIRLWNNASVRLFGASSERMIGTPIGPILPPHRRAEAEDALRRAIDDGASTEFEFTYCDVAEKTHELSVSVAPVVGESGRRVGASACIRDITRRITMQTQLDHHRKMAALGEMAGAVAHHFNNILGGIITSLDYAADNDDPILQRRSIEQASRGLARATALVNSLVAFAEGDRHTEDLADLTEIISALADELEENLARAGIKIILDVPKLPVIPVPRVPVGLALRNVTQNAADAMPDGGTLHIALALEGSWAVARISDTGCGFDQETLSRMFEPFWTTKGALGSRGGKATGLGLAVAHGAIQAIGGTISAESKGRGGSCFVIKMPRTPPDIPGRVQPPSPPETNAP